MRSLTSAVGIWLSGLSLLLATMSSAMLPANSLLVAGASPNVFTAGPTIAWGSCVDDALRRAHAQCGNLSVPLDYANPAGPHITIAVSRVRATAPAAKRQGPLLINPGGPGDSGLTQSAYLASALPKDVAATFDLIGFDPRGVGHSRPALVCSRGYQSGVRPRYTPRSARDPVIQTWLKRSADFARACQQSQPALLAHLTTVDAAKDLDQLRRALGVRRINYYGFSYGSYLGQVYATLFPTHTRRLVLDGVVDPAGVWYGAEHAQDLAFQTAIEHFFGWVAAHDAVLHLGVTRKAVQARNIREQRALDRKPIGVIGGDEWNDVFLDAGYFQSDWPEIAAAWRDWEQGKRAAFLGRYRDNLEDQDNNYAMYLGVQCVDAPWPRDFASWQRDAQRLAARAPFETWPNVWYDAPCLTWPVPGGHPLAINGTRTPEALLVNSTLDGATPYPGALAVRRLFPHAALVAQVGSVSHADTLNGNPCVDRAVLTYLRTGKLPARKAGDGPDVACKRSPLPTPKP
jgi:pimeloyl-ACP methyl ester carboxylesterase